MTEMFITRTKKKVHEEKLRRQRDVGNKHNNLSATGHKVWGWKDLVEMMAGSGDI